MIKIHVQCCVIDDISDRKLEFDVKNISAITLENVP